MTKPSTNLPQQSLRALIADDSYVAGFQTIGQYRAALLQQAAIHGTAAGTIRTPDYGVTLEEALYALDLVINKMNVPGLFGQRGYAEDVLRRAGQLDGDKNSMEAS
jgi:hypothetical protein